MERQRPSSPTYSEIKEYCIHGKTPEQLTNEEWQQMCDQKSYFDGEFGRDHKFFVCSEPETDQYHVFNPGKEESLGTVRVILGG